MESNSLEPGRWVILYGDYLYSLAIMKTGNKETAQDLVQETFLSAIKAKDTFNGLSSEKTWLTAILKNKVIDFYRKKDVLRDADDYLAGTDASFYVTFFDTAEESYGHWRQDAAPKAWAEGADTPLKRKEFYRILQYCIDKMPSKLVPAFVAKYVDEEDSEKICKELNLSSSNYWVMIHRAKVLMRSCLEKNWFLQ
jgi:RNA polymerase sigma-70 factor (TIGR02943 family)